MSSSTPSSARASAASFVAIEPRKTSEWPPTYLLSAWTLMSTPWSSGLKKTPAAQVLSMIVRRPCARAAATIAGTSCSSKVTEPGDSSTTTRVASVASAAISAAVARAG